MFVQVVEDHAVWLNTKPCAAEAMETVPWPDEWEDTGFGGETTVGGEFVEVVVLRRREN